MQRSQFSINQARNHSRHYDHSHKENSGMFKFRPTDKTPGNFEYNHLLEYTVNENGNNRKQKEAGRISEAHENNTIPDRRCKRKHSSNGVKSTLVIFNHFGRRARCL